MASVEEQETTVTYIKADKLVHIYSANPVHIRKIRKDGRATQISGNGDEWANFTVPATDFDPISGFKRRVKPLSDEERQRRADLLKSVRDRNVN